MCGKSLNSTTFSNTRIKIMTFGRDVGCPPIHVQKAPLTDVVKEKKKNINCICL